MARPGMTAVRGVRSSLARSCGSTVHGVVFAFLRRTSRWTVGSNGLHQYWDECLNLGQSLTVTEAASVAACLPLAIGIERTSQKHAKEQAKADAGSAIAQVPAPLAYPLQLVHFGWGVFTKSGLSVRQQRLNPRQTRRTGYG